MPPRVAPIVVPYHLQGGAGHGGVRVFHGVVRAYVYAVYKAGDSEAPNTSDPSTGVMCDLLLCEPGWAGLLRHVPVMVQSGGIDDHEHWTPRAMSATIDGTPLNLESGTGSTPLHETDGDLVVVSFLGGDLNRPIIIGQLSHPGTEQDYTTYEGYRWVRLLAGNLLGVTGDGDVLLDASGGSGKVTVRTDDDGTIVAEGKVVTVTVGGTTVTLDGDADTVTVDGADTTIQAGKLISKSSAAAVTQPVVLKQAQQDIVAVLEPLGQAMLLVDAALKTLTGSGVITDVAGFTSALASLSAQVDHLAANTESD